MGPQASIRLRLQAVYDAIAWGHAHFDQKRGLAYSSNGRAYTAQNLAYAGSLLEAVVAGREIGLSRQTAVRRATEIIRRVLEAPGPARGLPRWIGGRGRPQPAGVGAQAVLAFLDLNASRFTFDAETLSKVRKALSRFLPESESNSTQANRAKPRSAGSRAAARRQKFLSGLPGDFHWSDLPSPFGNDYVPADLPDLEWPWPPRECLEILKCAHDKACYVRLSPNQSPSIRTYFYKGDYKGSHGPTTPVVLVGGWNPFGDPGAGFEKRSDVVPYPPPPRAGGRHDHPPPIWEISARISGEESAPGYATHLCGAGYDHVRFVLSAPGDDIQIAVDELYAVVDAAKSLYGVSRVILVGHSRGGLIIRKYILDRWNKKDGMVDVAKVITFGTPHQGAQLAELGSPFLNSAVLELMPGFTAQQIEYLQLALNLVGIDLTQIDLLSGELTQFLSDVARLFWEDLGAALESMEQLRPGSSFIMELNEAYAEPRIQIGERQASFWQAIPHVLVAGTNPSYVAFFVGCWLQYLGPDPVAAAAALYELVDVDGFRWRRLTRWLRILLPYFNWNWKWHRVLDVPGTFVAASPTLQVIPALVEGSGDIVVEKASAWANGVEGAIVRSELPLNHFNMLTVPIPGHHPPSNWGLTASQIILFELGVPPGTLSGCEPETYPCR